MKKKYLTYLIIAGFVIAFGAGIISGNNFTGTDETVNKIANEYAKAVGAGERPPVLNTDRGDLFLFLFGISGAVVGFYLGYQWRNIFPDVKEGEHGS